MSDITVRRNWKKKITALSNVTKYSVYSLSGDFKECILDTTPTEMEAFIIKELTTFRHSRLSYNKETGACCLHIHSNLWFQWNCKIDW